MRIEPCDPRTLSRWEHGPIHHYHVVFWRQPHVPPEALPAGATQEQVMWAAQENEVLDVPDVVEALRWAEDEARKSGAIFQLFAVVDLDRQGMVWLAGWLPTKPTGPNYERRRPPDVNPTHGASSEVYSGRDEGSTGPMFTA